ncbi:MAG: glycosyltransferase family 2 protein [Candidatus Altiarchaeota archaeon]|nr:glycosyltransferase family 2 protein [Candidatus Altiarchaeota archaeon]
MKLSVVIPTYNCGGTIKDAIDSLFNQSISEDYEVIVVDDASNDDTETNCGGYSHRKNFHYIRLNKRLGASRARNVGLKNAKGEIVAFTDADCIPTKYWIQEMSEAFKKNKKAAGVGGRVIYDMPAYLTTIRDRLNLSFGVNQMSEGDMVEMYATANIGYKKSVLDKVGGFDEGYLRGEDFELAFRILELNVGDIVFDKELIVFHAAVKYGRDWRLLFRHATMKKFILEQAILKGRFQSLFWGRIFLPNDLLTIFAPPILLLTQRYKSIWDLFFLPLFYITKCYERIVIWETAIKYGRFIV